MPDNEVQIRVGTDLSQLESDAKSLGSSFDELGRTGAGNFGALRGKVVELTAELVNLKKQLAATSDPADMERLNSSITKTKDQMSLARTELRGMTMASRESSEALALLSNQFSIQIPMGMDRVLAKSPMVQAGILQAFNGIVIGAFIGSIEAAIMRTDAFAHAIGALTEDEVKAVQTMQDENNRAMGMGQKMQDQLNVLRATGIDKVKAEGVAAMDSLKQELSGMQNLEPQYRNNLLLLQQEINATKLQTEQHKEAEEAANKAAQAEQALAQAESQLGSVREQMASKMASITGNSEDQIRLEYQGTYDLLNRLEASGLVSHEKIEAAITAVVAAQAAAREKIYMDEAEKEGGAVQQAQAHYQTAVQHFSDQTLQHEISGLQGIAKIRADGSSPR